MIVFLLGVITLVVLMAALGMFSRAQITTIKRFGIWVVALGGLVMAALLFLTGRGATAIAALAMLGPLVWSWMAESKRGAARPAGQANFGRRPGSATGAMTRDEAYEILGLKPGASEADIRAAHLRLMQAAHPDHGGSDWLAARINQARDTLLA
jgi:DnaJ family protein C protein 19